MSDNQEKTDFIRFLEQNTWVWIGILMIGAYIGLCLLFIALHFLGIIR